MTKPEDASLRTVVAANLFVAVAKGRRRAAHKFGSDARRDGPLVALGVQTLRHPEPVTDVAVSAAVLLVTAGLEAMSWRTAHRQLRSEAAARHLDLGEYLATSSVPRQPQCSWRTRQH